MSPVPVVAMRRGIARALGQRRRADAAAYNRGMSAQPRRARDDRRPAERVVDFGVGEVERVEIAKSDEAYRETDRVACLYLGDPVVARARLTNLLRMEGLALILVAAICLHHLLAWR